MDFAFEIQALLFKTVMTIPPIISAPNLAGYHAWVTRRSALMPLWCTPASTQHRGWSRWRTARHCGRLACQPIPAQSGPAGTMAERYAQSSYNPV